MKIPYNYFPEFVLRTPLLDFPFYKNLTSGETVSNEHLKNAYKNPIVKEAMFLASPTLYFEIEKWINGQLDIKKEKKIKFSLLKYLTRMATRCTPFGLFAGCSLGGFSDITQITNTTPDRNKRHTRLDMNYLVALSQDLAKKKEIREQLLYYPNSSIYLSGNQLRYIEYYYVESRRHHHIVEVDNSAYLQNILKRARTGAHLKNLAQLLVNDGIPENEATVFIEELLESQVLISELEPSVSGPEFMVQILGILKKLKETDNEVFLLKKTEEQLYAIDSTIGNNPKKYLGISESLKKYPTSFELKYLFQADMELRPKTNKLSKSVAESIQKGMVLLNRITAPSQENNLNNFKKAFFERYEEREMPLAKALDVEIGIGYIQDRGSGDVNPLVDNLVLPQQEDIYGTTKLNLNGIHETLLEKLILCDREGSQKIILNDKDFEKFPVNWEDLPDTISAMVELVNDNGEEKIKFSGTGGSSAVNLLGRFCHADRALYNYTKSITGLEDRMNLDKVLAEIVHLPEARVGNILMRPALRKYEIPYLARSVVNTENQISLDDLYVSVKNDKILLRSKKLNKEVLPRLANAHNFSFNSLPIYHFLCDLQTSDLRGGLYFNFGPLESGRNFLPRVEYENLIFHEAKWKIRKEDIQPLLNKSENTPTLKIAVEKFRKSYKLPQYTLLSDGDNELLINFNNMTTVQMLLDMVKNRPDFLLSEFLFADHGVVRSSKGYHTNQLVISFFNEKKLELQKQDHNG